MGAFDKVIGYEYIKDELLQVCDMIRNREVYEKLGAILPRGILLEGDPGLGKTLMAGCFIEESGLKSYIIRRTKEKGVFLKYITEVFQKAAENAPAVVLLDDLDKFANEDENHQNAEEYVAVQSEIDAAKDSGIIVVATANDTDKLPESLLRPGRFDIRLYVKCPTDDDACALVQKFLSDKQVSESVDVVDLSKMIAHISCAKLESILNQAAIIAASKRKESIEMEDLVKGVLRMHYGSHEIYAEASDEEIRKTAVHEAGHLVVAEVLNPESIGLISIREKTADDVGGFVRRCKSFNRRQEILVSLAGKAATELYYSETCADGCQSDIRRAINTIAEGLIRGGTRGLGFVESRYPESGQHYAQLETAAYAELERVMFEARDILLKNKAFLEKVTDALIKKETLLFSDIREIRESVEIVNKGYII